MYFCISSNKNASKNHWAVEKCSKIIQLENRIANIFRDEYINTWLFPLNYTSKPTRQPRHLYTFHLQMCPKCFLMCSLHNTQTLIHSTFFPTQPTLMRVTQKSRQC